MNVITLIDYRPLPRYDGIPWTQARVEESAAEGGPWNPVGTFNLDPVDADPRYPRSRSFTVEDATIPSGGWYRVTFIDQTGDEQLPTDPVQYTEVVDPTMPTVDDIGALERSRTVNGAGEELGTFSYETRPTDIAVQNIIRQASRDVAMRVGPIDQLDPKYYEDAKQLIGIRTAMLIELSYFPEQIPTQESPYPQWKTLYDDGITSLYGILHPGSTEGGGGGIIDPGYPDYAFPTEDDVHPMVGWKTVW